VINAADGQARTAILPYPADPAKSQLREPASSSEAVQGSATEEIDGSQAAFIAQPVR
jgi:hypothetical protein